jgi:MinD-like ATPase involved in chromosome partitioning or flagellar assembly
VASSILQLASANPESSDDWLHEVFRVARPLGPVSPRADLLAGVLQPWLRYGISASFVERLVAELRRQYTYILLDLGNEPLGEPTGEAAVTAAALQAADQIVVVCPPDGPGLHQTYMALAQVDTAAVQRALAEGRPVVCDRRSKLRRPLLELTERVHGGRVEVADESRKRTHPAWGADCGPQHAD